MNQDKKKWGALPPEQRVGIVAMGAFQLTLIATALTDLWRRPASQIRGSKKMWTPVVFINFIGPLAYLLFGRRR